MTTPSGTDENVRHEESSTHWSHLKMWRKGPAAVTREWLVYSAVIGFAFVAIAIYAAVSTARLDNRVTAESLAQSNAQQVAACVASNGTRADAATIATAGVKSDLDAIAGERKVWATIDEAFPDGLPEQIKASLDLSFSVREASLTARQKLIDVTYMPRDCDELARSLARPGDSVPADAP